VNTRLKGRDCPRAPEITAGYTRPTPSEPRESPTQELGKYQGEAMENLAPIKHGMGAIRPHGEEARAPFETLAALAPQGEGARRLEP